MCFNQIRIFLLFLLPTPILPDVYKRQDKKHLLLQEIKSLPYYNTASNKAYLFKCLYVKGTFLQLRICLLYTSVLTGVKQLDDKGAEVSYQKFDYYDDVQAAKGLSLIHILPFIHSYFIGYLKDTDFLNLLRA